jgi:hypothetical protein
MEVVRSAVRAAPGVLGQGRGEVGLMRELSSMMGLGEVEGPREKIARVIGMGAWGRVGIL